MLANLTPKKLFLIDGIGAIVTTLLLSQVLARFEAEFGMPAEILYILATIAGCFAVYSLLCHFLITENRRALLRGIAVANSLYCLGTLGLVIYQFESLTWLGIAYFLGEIVIVMVLVGLELKVAQKKKGHRKKNL